LATKSRNSFLKSVTFTVAILLLGYSILAAVNFSVFYDYVQKDSYFKTNEFINRLTRSIYDLRAYYVTYDFADYEKKTPEQKISSEELKIALEDNKKNIEANVERIKSDFQYNIDAFKDDVSEQTRLILERDKAIELFRKENEKTEEQIKKELLQDKDQQFNYLKNNVQQWKSIKYYLNDKVNGRVYTNLPENTDINSYIAKGMLYNEKYPKQILSKEEIVHEQINNVLLDAKLEGYILIPQEADNYSDVYWLSSDFQNIRNRLINEAKVGGGAFFIAIILLIFSLRKKDEEKTVLDNLTRFYVKIPMELRLILFALSAGIFLSLLFEVRRYVLEMPMPAYVIFSITCSIFMLFILLHIRGFYNIIRSGENFRTQWRGTLLYRLISFMYNIFLHRNLTLKVVVILVATMFLGIDLIALISINDGFIKFIALLYFMAYIAFVPYFVLNRVIYFNQVVKGAGEIVSGNFEYVIEEKGNGIIRTLAHNFNNIKNGFKRSMENQMKSERLKTELITNVSHDLKTPLTSIINYVDLLKSKEISEEEKDGYIEVLDRKAQRLKVLIEDLFEAAKMSSGVAELNREKVDIVAILRQTLGEFDEKINSSSLIFRVNIPSEKVYLILDGKKTWRVFENLVNNTLKYSQPNTRVYIDLIETDTSVKITIKNIANYEMDFDVEEIFERFKRGDKSRNTEGSGIGLAIAKSIVELQNGKMNIDLDGDLFKVTVEFRK
jgi:signal transduction histidine kinase